jgi:hypothetical protein
LNLSDEARIVFHDVPADGSLGLDWTQPHSTMRVGRRPAIDGVTNQACTVQFRDSLDNGSWSNLVNVAAPQTNGPINILDPGAAAASPRFYRAITPAIQ